MKKTLLKFFSLFILIGLVSCRAGRVPVRTAPVNGTATTYIDDFKDLAISEMRRTGVPASITLAQGMLESDYGRSSLARVANNHFGIKCHSDWNGQTMRQHDDRRNECFRKYGRPEDSFYDHSEFLRSGSRYNFLFTLDPQDYKAWAHGLKKAGYATNPDYANLIIRKIEENKLYLYDSGGYLAQSLPEKNRQVALSKKPDSAVEKRESASAKIVALQKEPVREETITFGEVMALAPRIMENNRVQYIVVRDGETKEKIESEFQLLKRDLASYNDLPDSFTPVAGQILYIGPKRDKAEAGREFHTAAEGDTMHSISQKYGVRLRSLLDMNLMPDSIPPVPGQKIWLHATKPAN